MEEEYEGWKIKYDEKGKIFIAEKDDVIRRGNDLIALRERLKKKFKRRKAFYGTKEVEVTSIREEKYGVYYRISYDGARQKVYNNIYKYTEKNKKLVEQIREIDESTQELHDKRRKLDDQLERFKKDELSR